MSDLENQEFRECALLAMDAWAGRNYTKGEECVTVVDMLARAMRIAAEETADQIWHPEIEGALFKVVASRISSRIKGQK